MQEIKDNLIEKTVLFVKETLQGAEGGHDWFHIERVWKNAKLIAQNETVSHEIIELGALLHDIADPKFYDGDETIGPKMAREFLEQNKVAEATILHVENIIKYVSFKNGDTSAIFDSKELQVVRDADRLDAIGAIGIARTFNYGGFKNRVLYDPEISPKLDQTKEEYKKSTAPTINHFYEKLLTLKDKIHTDSAKEIAEKRHQFMVDFLDQFHGEWNGER